MQLFHAGGSSEVLARNTMDSILSNVQGYADVVHRETVRSVGGLTAFASALGARPGRKAVFVVADGIVMRPLEELSATLMRTLSRRGSGSERAGEMNDASSMQVIDARPSGGQGTQVEDLTRSGGPDFAIGKLQQGLQQYAATDEFLRLAAVANSARVTLYPIRPPQEDAASAGLGNRPGGEGSRPLSDTQEGLILMADSTGGEAFLVGDDVAGFIDRVAAGHLRLLLARVRAARQDRGPASTSSRSRPRAASSCATDRATSPRPVSAASPIAPWARSRWAGSTTRTRSRSRSTRRTAPRTATGTCRWWCSSRSPSSSCWPRTASIAPRARSRWWSSTRAASCRARSSWSCRSRSPRPTSRRARQQHFGARVNLRLPPGPQKVAIGLWDETAAIGSFISRDLDIGSLAVQGVTDRTASCRAADPPTAAPARAAPPTGRASLRRRTAPRTGFRSAVRRGSTPTAPTSRGFRPRS